VLGLITEVTGFLRGLNFFLLLIALLAIVVYVLIALPIQIHLMYEGKGKRHSLLLRFQIFNGRIGVGTKFLFGQQIESELPKLGQVKKTGIKLFSRFKRTSRRRNINSLNEVKFYYLTVKKFINFIKVFMRHSVCKRFAWDTTVGLKDYAATGIATGLLWALKGYIIGCLSRWLRILPPGPRFRVVPKFGKTDFEISLDCILETRLGHIMIQLMKFLFWWIQISLNKKGSTRRWKDWATIRSKHS